MDIEENVESVNMSVDEVTSNLKLSVNSDDDIGYTGSKDYIINIALSDRTRKK